MIFRSVLGLRAICAASSVYCVPHLDDAMLQMVSHTLKQADVARLVLSLWRMCRQACILRLSCPHKSRKSMQ